jgi:hypothetical protein
VILALLRETIFFKWGNDMTLKTGLVALMAMTTITSAAMADCRVVRFRFFPPQNDSVSATGVSSGGSACTHRFRSLSTLQMTSGAIVARPSSGTLSEVGALQFRYAPKAGFKGTDRYAVRICGKGGSGSGCSTITYNMTVQ